ncbi:MAG: hypothetical protein AVDCRST_MAG26-1242, partial [uncultured Chloroflexia bacterium]
MTGMGDALTAPSPRKRDDGH